ncbi:ATP-dependent DNA helicase PIF1-like protein [Tanacetum coccineum]
MFITSTSNPKWPKITEMLAFHPGKKPHERPEVGTRVFKMKLTKVLDDLTKREVFGKSRAAACDAVWHLFSFDIHYSYPSVMKLNFHLPDQNAITLHGSQNLSSLLQREDIKITMFTEWFELNKRDTAVWKLTYVELPKYYVWDDRAKN